MRLYAERMAAGSVILAQKWSLCALEHIREGVSRITLAALLSLIVCQGGSLPVLESRHACVAHAAAIVTTAKAAYSAKPLVPASAPSWQLAKSK